MDLHASLEAISGLVGTWRGRGVGVYPTIPRFEYLEEATFGHVGKPFLAYGQKTRNAETDMALHAESGYMRPGVDGVTEWVITQPTGIVEVLIASSPLDFRSETITLTPTAKSVTDVRRKIELHGDTLWYRVEMAAVGEPLQLHLEATLTRVS